ncbi:MAG: DUF2283 domain-containing protein [Streptosporangiaceae bacterium]
MIELKWDTEADALYIELTTDTWDHTDEIEDGTYVYSDAHNNPIGIEVHHPDRPWPLNEVLTHYNMNTDAARQLRAYFPQPAMLTPTAHPPARVPVTVPATPEDQASQPPSSHLPEPPEFLRNGVRHRHGAKNRDDRDTA